MEEINNSTMNSTTPEISTNSSTHSSGFVVGSETCVFSISFLFGVPTHSYVIWLIITGTESGIASGFFNLNLSVCEIGVCLNCLISVLVIWFSSLKPLTLFFIGIIFTGRPLFQCLICVERYLAVVHPVTFLKFKPLRYRVICSTAVWIICLVSCVSCVLIEPSSNNNVYTWIFLIQFLLFLSVQLFCLLAVLRALKQSGPGERGRERGEENHIKRRAFNIILITTVTMLVMYGPFVFTGICNILTQQIINALWLTGLICYLFPGLVQPVLYLHLAGKLSCFCSSINLLF